MDYRYHTVFIMCERACSRPLCLCDTLPLLAELRHTTHAALSAPRCCMCVHIANSIVKHVYISLVPGLGGFDAAVSARAVVCRVVRAPGVQDGHCVGDTNARLVTTSDGYCDNDPLHFVLSVIAFCNAASRAWLTSVR